MGGLPYDPSVGRFLTEDPLGFEAGINFYAYVNNNPINANDPTGLTTYYIGGGWDNLFGRSGPVKGYFDNNGGGLYYGHTEGRKIINNVRANQTAFNSVNTNLVGHSFGGDTALELIGKGLNVNTLVTIDPVGSVTNFEMTNAAENSNLWINVHATPTDRDFSDFIADRGGNYKLKPAGFADIHETININHKYFGTMLNTPLSGAGGLSAQQLVNTPSLISTNPQNQFFTTPAGGNSGASGGFVLYPSRPNLNMMNQVYVK